MRRADGSICRGNGCRRRGCRSIRPAPWPRPGLPAVCTRVLARARALFAQAHAAMAQCDRRAMRPARLMGASYAALLDRLEARGWARLAEPVRVPKWQKLWIAARYLT